MKLIGYISFFLILTQTSCKKEESEIYSYYKVWVNTSNGVTYNIDIPTEISTKDSVNFFYGYQATKVKKLFIKTDSIPKGGWVAIKVWRTFDELVYDSIFNTSDSNVLFKQEYF